jgi:hypothetical protein
MEAKQIKLLHELSEIFPIEIRKGSECLIRDVDLPNDLRFFFLISSFFYLLLCVSLSKSRSLFLLASCSFALLVLQSKMMMWSPQDWVILFIYYYCVANILKYVVVFDFSFLFSPSNSLLFLILFCLIIL